MYTVKTRIFGEYVEEGSVFTLERAVEKAKEINSYGWQYVRIIHPDGAVTQIYGQSDEDSLAELI
jgi:hypothetical protein